MAAASERGREAGLPRELDRILHDLRGPLNAVVMHVEFLKHAVRGDENARRSLETVERELQRLARMLPAAFSVAGLEREHDAPVDLRSLVEHAVQEHAAGRVAVQGEAWPEVRGEERLLSLAVEHLVRNAVEATAAAGRGKPDPEILLATDGKMAVLTVRDHGVGLASTNPRAVIHLGASTKRNGEGTGLLTVERIARLHAGTLAFESRPDGGTDVHLSLPLA